MKQSRITRLLIASASIGLAACGTPDQDETVATNYDALCSAACGCSGTDDHAGIRSPVGLTDGSCAEPLAGATSGTPKLGFIGTVGDADFFKFQTPGGYRTYTFITGNQSAQPITDLYCEGFTSANAPLRSWYHNDINVTTNKSCRIAFTTSLSQWYYFKVTHATGGTGSYAAWMVVPAVGDGGDTLGIVDTDGDGYATEDLLGPLEVPDNCPTVANPSQADHDSDGLGDACDPDCPAGEGCEVETIEADDDADDDGVSDETDNCPDTANADQANNDGDTEGDACDGDDDNDGAADGSDNCPLLANADQADLDGDLTGNACDLDDDGDDVADGSDNCALLANPDQANSDGDAKGNDCDEDDDNDGVLDETDNCQFIANASQADFDADGYGDPCDKDQDSDGVQNTYDVCPDTPRGLVVSQSASTKGCSGGQIVELRCDLSTAVNHGAYVDCVSLACDEAIALGVMTGREKGRQVSTAAHADN